MPVYKAHQAFQPRLAHGMWHMNSATTAMHDEDDESNAWLGEDFRHLVEIVYEFADRLRFWVALLGLIKGTPKS